MTKALSAIFTVMMLMGVTGCAKDRIGYDYALAAFQQEQPKSIVVLPAKLTTDHEDADPYFVSAVHKPLAEKGYYVFPVQLVREYLKKKNIETIEDLYQLPSQTIADYFNADSVLYTDFIALDATYAVVGTHTFAEFAMKLVSGRTGQTFWEQGFSYGQSSNNAGAGLLGALLTAAIGKAAPPYRRVAWSAVASGINNPNFGLVTGPYHGSYQQDLIPSQLSIESGLNSTQEESGSSESEEKTRK